MLKCVHSVDYLWPILQRKAACLSELLFLNFPLQIIPDNEHMYKTQITQIYYFTANWVSFYPVQKYLLLMETVEIAADVKTVLQSVAEVAGVNNDIRHL